MSWLEKCGVSLAILVFFTMVVGTGSKQCSKKEEDLPTLPPEQKLSRIESLNKILSFADESTQPEFSPSIQEETSTRASISDQGELTIATERRRLDFGSLSRNQLKEEYVLDRRNWQSVWWSKSTIDPGKVVKIELASQDASTIVIFTDSGVVRESYSPRSVFAPLRAPPDGLDESLIDGFAVLSFDSSERARMALPLLKDLVADLQKYSTIY